MTDQQILDHILEFLDEYVGIAGANAETRLFEKGLDSLQVADLSAFLEYRFGVKIPESAVTLDDFATPRRLVSLVRRFESVA